MGFEYVGMWDVHNTAKIQMEGGINYSNLTHPISNGVLKDSWWY
jgi:hypothetical protein